MSKISAIIPAYNEAESIALVVQGLMALRDSENHQLIYEIIVADNGSSDHTAAIAHANGAIVVSVAERGYGVACSTACKSAQGDVLLFVDGDHTADLAQAQLLTSAVHNGADMAIGVRTKAQAGSLTLPQRFGNFLACCLMRFIWAVPVTDLGPFRAVRRSAYELIGMRDRAFGWTIEMQIRAAQLQLNVCEIDVTWLPRYAGQSKVSGTIKGVIGAGWGILSMIAKLWWRERCESRVPRSSALSISVEGLPAGQTPLDLSTSSRPLIKQE